MGLFDSATAAANQNTSQNSSSVSTGTSETSVETLPKFSKEQEDLLKYLTSYITSGLSGGGTTPYPGQLWAPLNAYEKTYLAGDSSNQQNRETALRNVLSGQPGYTINAQTTQDYWNKYLQPQVDKQERLLRESYAPNYFGGGKDIALGEFNTGVTGQYANLMYQDEQARRQAIENALERQSANAVPAWSANVENEYNKGALQRQVDESKLASEYLRWTSGERMPDGSYNAAANPFLNYGLSLMGISPYIYMPVTNSSETSTSTSTGYGTGTSNQTGPGPGYGLLTGGANSLAPIIWNSATQGAKAFWDYINNGGSSDYNVNPQVGGNTDQYGNVFDPQDDPSWIYAINNPSSVEGTNWNTFNPWS